MSQFGPYQPGPPPPGYVLPQPPPPRKSRKGWIIAGVCVALLLAAGCVYGAGRALVALKHRAEAAADVEGPFNEPERPPTVPTVGPDETEDPNALRASSYDVRSAKDLDRVCDRWFYPNAPKHASTKAPHPIAVSVRDRNDVRYRSMRPPRPDFDVPDKVRNAWAGDRKPATVQLVACVDLAAIGKTVKTCTMDKPATPLPLKRATYRVTVYEVATRRQLFDKKMPGEQEDCPLFAMVGKDKELYTELEDGQLLDALAPLVEK